MQSLEHAELLMQKARQDEYTVEKLVSEPGHRTKSLAFTPSKRSRKYSRQSWRPVPSRIAALAIWSNFSKISARTESPTRANWRRFVT
jgi:hypothetical protein